MKAEHRKELQTNSLADALGRTVRGVRSGSGFSWFYVFLVCLVLLGIAGYFWVANNRARVNAESWALLQRNDVQSFKDILEESPDNKQGVAVRFTIGFKALWDAINMLGVGDSEELRKQLGRITDHFTKLAEDCKDDHELCAEAKYHMAVATESQAVFDSKISGTSLDKAKKLFEELTQGDLKSTGYGKMAQKRLDQYNNPTEFLAIARFYAEFQSQSRFSKLGGSSGGR